MVDDHPECKETKLTCIFVITTANLFWLGSPMFGVDPFAFMSVSSTGAGALVLTQPRRKMTLNTDAINSLLELLF